MENVERRIKRRGDVERIVFSRRKKKTRPTAHNLFRTTGQSLRDASVFARCTTKYDRALYAIETKTEQTPIKKNFV